MANFAVVTSIYEPSVSVRRLAALDRWRVIVVGDQKTPSGWECPNVTYLSPAEQLETAFLLAKRLPWNHYCRKMLGYLHALRQGADLVADMDDDNIPMHNWGQVPPHGTYDTVTESGFVNVYKFFTDAFIWPRGFPLDQIRTERRDQLQELPARIGIWQFLANNEADVDAIYRLLFNHATTFSRQDPVVLDEGVFCPSNSQNAIFLREAFLLLYLPAFVSIRFTDVLRGLVAQPILWTRGLRLGFGPATAVQERNPHAYFKDFEAEITTYLYAEKAAYIAANAVKSGNSVGDNLVAAYSALAGAGIVEDRELPVLEAWLKDAERAQADSPG